MKGGQEKKKKKDPCVGVVSVARRYIFLDSVQIPFSVAV
jgi:hypothetical protein